MTRKVRKEWTNEEIEILRMLAGKVSGHQIGKRLGRDRNTVYNKARLLGISLDGYKDTRVWTPEDDAKLKKLAGRITAEKIGDQIGRTKAAVNSRAKALKISLSTRGGKNPFHPINYVCWTPDDTHKKINSVFC